MKNDKNVRPCFDLGFGLSGVDLPLRVPYEALRAVGGLVVDFENLDFQAPKITLTSTTLKATLSPQKRIT